MEFDKIPGRRVTLTYKTTPAWDLVMEILYPVKEPNNPMPVYLNLHGGGFVRGDRKVAAKSAQEVVMKLSERGYAGIFIDYRFADGTITLPDLVEDCKDAIRFVHREGEILKLDPDRLAVWGRSAGGHLAMLAGLSENSDFPGDESLKQYSSAVRCMINWYGPSDFTPQTRFYSDNDERIDVLFGKKYDEDPDLYHCMSPYSFLKKSSPPLLCVHGEDDPIVPLEQSRIMFEKGHKLGAKVTFIPVANAGHNWENNDKAIPMADELADITADFIETHTRVL